MATNATPQFYKAQIKFTEATTPADKLKALQEMLKLCPKHKSAESLLSEIKQKIARYKDMLQKEKLTKKKGKNLSIKKEGAAQICIIGPTNTGKSTLLYELTKAEVDIAAYPFTTRKPIIGTMDYEGIKLQTIEIPALTKDTYSQPNGPTYLGIIRQADLLIYMYNNEKELELIKSELKGNDIKVKPILYPKNKDDIKREIWIRLNLIKISTKQPGKKPTYPPLALKKDSTVKDFAEHVHRDFSKKFKFARVWGESVKHNSMKCGLKHILKEGDIVELHTS